MHFRELQEEPCKGEIQLHDVGCEPCIYIRQITTKKLCTLNFTLFKTRYIGLGVRFYKRSVCTLPLAELNARVHKSVYFSTLVLLTSVLIGAFRTLKVNQISGDSVK
jgi:hypothetical protein